LLRRFEVASVEHLQKSNVHSHVNPCGDDYAIKASKKLVKSSSSLAFLMDLTAGSALPTPVAAAETSQQALREVAPQ